MAEPNKAPKRTKPQIEFDRMRMADLLLKGFSRNDIRNIIEDETGVSLSLTTIRNDIKAIRKEWQKERVESYDEMVNREESRLDALESELWGAWRSSCKDDEREVVEKLAKQVADDPDQIELIISKVTTTRNDKKGVGDTKIMAQIIDVQKERRKLRGLYAPATLGVNINTKSELTVKGYGHPNVSPDVWPDIIDGEVVEQKLIKSGE
jgi:hypothetical protein